MKIFALILILFMTTLAFGQENEKVGVPMDTIYYLDPFIISYFELESCTASQDYNSIFTSTMWDDINCRYLSLMSSSGMHRPYHNWQFRRNKIKVTAGYIPYAAIKGKHTKTTLTYKFDKENKLIFINNGKPGNKKQDFVLKPCLYTCEDYEVLVLHIYPEAKRKTPIETILKGETVHYKTLFRYKNKTNVEVQTNRKCDMDTIKMKLQDSWGMGKSYQSPATLEEKQQLQNLFKVDAANIGSAFVFESEKTRKEKIKKNNEEFAKLKEDEIISFNYPPQYSGNINIQLKEDDSFAITYTQERAAPHDGFYLATQIMKGNWNIVENILTLNITEQSFTKDSESQLLPIVFLNIPVSESLNKEITCNFSFHFEEENLILSPIDINTND